MLLMISYDAPSEKETQLVERLKSAKGWWNYLSKVWIIATERSKREWQDQVKATLGEAGSYIILDVSNVFLDGWLPQSAWDWVNKQQRACKGIKDTP